MKTSRAVEYRRQYCQTCGTLSEPRPVNTVVPCQTCLLGPPPTTKEPEPDLTVTGPGDYWLSLITDDVHDRYDDTLIERAIDRLIHGDVAKTCYGWRVNLRPDLGDHRQDAAAYWPEQNACCLCWSRNTHGACSHELAVALAKRRLLLTQGASA